MTPDQFWAQVDRSSGPKACWPWTKSTYEGGYGKVRMAKTGHVFRAHRVAWTLTNGPIPRRLLVRHSCDNPPCCNPAHLLLGTDQDNADDRVTRGRTISEGHFSRVTPAQVLEIRRRHALSGGSHRALGAEYGVSKSTITDILTRATWANLE